MIQKHTIKQRRPKRVARIRSVIKGTALRPRLAIFRSNTHIYGQLIDDAKGVTLATMRQIGKNKPAGTALGESIVTACKKRAISALVFDRGGNKYHGVIQEIAETVRKGGLTV